MGPHLVAHRAPPPPARLAPYLAFTTVQARQSIARSLANLRTDRIDSLVLHSPLPSLAATLDVWRAFEEAADAGTVAQLGISNWRVADRLYAPDPARALSELRGRAAGVNVCVRCPDSYDAALFASLYDAARVKPKVLQNRFYDKSGYDKEVVQSV